MRSFQLSKFSGAKFRSHTNPEKITGKEKWLGFCFGPALVATLYAGVSGAYLNTFYTDVLGLNVIAGGVFLALMPVVSKLIDAITNIIMGQIVDNTKSMQGKARPWILISGPIMTITAILLFAVPRTSTVMTAVWVVCSYNLYFACSYTMYNLSNVALIALSTRDNKQRDQISMATSIGINMVPGLVLAVLFPSFILPYVGTDQTRWIFVMSTLAILSIPGSLLQYYFTRERITEESSEEKKYNKSLKEQIRGCMSSKYWILIMLVMVIYQIYNNFSLTSMVYYSNWVLGSYNDGTTLSLLNIIGQAMLGPGIVILWPLVGKVGKQKVYVVGSIIAALGGIMGIMNAKNLVMVLVALTIRSIGSLPITYLTLSMLADALDHVEWKSGFRCDGFSSSVYSIIITLSAGISTGIFNLGLSMTGYQSPALVGTIVEQSEAVQKFFISGMFGIPMAGAVLLFIIFLQFNLEKKLPQMKEELEARRGGAANE